MLSSKNLCHDIVSSLKVAIQIYNSFLVFFPEGFYNFFGNIFIF